jgi:DNA-binding NarL/FixJ family response regulator
MKRARILLADDHAIVVEAFERLLEPHHDVVGTVGDGQELLETAAQLRPDVAVVDILMPNLNGLDAARILKKAQPSMHIVFLTSSEDPTLAAEAIAAGASAFLIKRNAGVELLQAIQYAMQGQTYVTPSMAGDIFEAARSGAKPDLTPRQREVLGLLVEGLTMGAIAKRLGVSRTTIAHHKYTMMESLGVKTSAELIRYAVKHGFGAG